LLLEPLAGDSDVAAHAVAFVVHHAKTVHRGGFAERNGLFEQAARLGSIAGYAFGMEIEQAEKSLMSGEDSAG
jgi:hypothetical protein